MALELHFFADVNLPVRPFTGLLSEYAHGEILAAVIKSNVEEVVGVLTANQQTDLDAEVAIIDAAVGIEAKLAKIKELEGVLLLAEYKDMTIYNTQALLKTRRSWL